MDVDDFSRRHVRFLKAGAFPKVPLHMPEPGIIDLIGFSFTAPVDFEGPPKSQNLEIQRGRGQGRFLYTGQSNQVTIFPKLRAN